LKHILLTNDDGVHAPGIHALQQALEGLAEITVIAPLTEQSATSHSLTLHRPLRIHRISERVWGVQGTPTDCVLVAVKEFMGHRPDLVLSGFNQGPNLGEDVLYSGTVAAAMEGALLGIGSVALSLATWTGHDFGVAGTVARRLVERLLSRELPPRFLLNVNIPPLPLESILGYKLCRLGSRVYDDAIIKKTDPRGKDYYWIGGAEPRWKSSADSDFSALEEGYVSMTPILLDLTDDAGFGFLSTLAPEWP